MGWSAIRRGGIRRCIKEVSGGALNGVLVGMICGVLGAWGVRWGGVLGGMYCIRLGNRLVIRRGIK